MGVLESTTTVSRTRDEQFRSTLLCFIRWTSLFSLDLCLSEHAEHIIVLDVTFHIVSLLITSV